MPCPLDSVQGLVVTFCNLECQLEFNVHHLLLGRLQNVHWYFAGFCSPDSGSTIDQPVRSSILPLICSAQLNNWHFIESETLLNISTRIDQDNRVESFAWLPACSKRCRNQSPTQRCLSFTRDAFPADGVAGTHPNEP